MSDTTFNKIMNMNEKEANIVVGKITTITFGTFTIVYILNLLGIFIIDSTAMTIAYWVSAVLLLSPLVINKLCDTTQKWIKYLYVVLTSLFLLVITTTLTYHVVVMYAYPIVVAGIYFSKKLTNIAEALTVAVTILGQIFGYILNWRPDYNFVSVKALVLYGILPRTLILISFAALLQLLTKRTSRLLQEDAENYDQLARYNRNMIYGFATLVENRDESTGGHIKRTSLYAKLLAEELKKDGVYSDEITDEFINCISMVAPLHDIGKISIPDSILQKPGKLTPEEFDVMKTHSIKGEKIIKETFYNIGDDYYRNMAYDVARAHHEKWNGMGYPNGISGKDIPLSARIMSVADVFDAVSEKRCYREAMPLDKCFAIIEDGRDRDFDPVIVDAFLRIKDEVIKVHNKNME